MRKIKTKIKFVSFLLVFVGIFSFFIYRIQTVSDKYASSVMASYVIKEIYEICADVTEKNKSQLASSVIIEKDESGKVMSLTLDTATVNLIASEIITKSNLITENERTVFEINIGDFFGITLLSGYGIDMAFSLKPLGYVTGNIKSIIEDSGVNTSLHRVVLEIKGTVSATTPFSESVFDFSVDYVLCENLIFGEIPEFFLFRDA